VRFSPKLVPTLATLIVFPILLSLGFWQLHRAEFKQTLLATYQSRAQKLPLTLNKIRPNKDYKYYRIKITGHYDTAHPFLLDNRSHQHRIGYQVLIPFVPDNSKRALLINLGWIPRARDRKQLPALKTVPEDQTISGKIYLPTKNPFSLSEAHDHSSSWPKVIQTIQLKKLATTVNYSFYPFVVLLSPKAAHGYVRSWKPINVSPNKHLGYAVQWFALALALLIIFIVVNIKRESKKS